MHAPPWIRYERSHMLAQEMERSGRWLFRYRNHLPLVLVPLIVLALPHSGGIESTFGSAAAGVWEAACIAIALTGLVVRCVVVGYCPPGASGMIYCGHEVTTINGP